MTRNILFASLIPFLVDTAFGAPKIPGEDALKNSKATQPAPSSEQEAADRVASVIQAQPSDASFLTTGANLANAGLTSQSYSDAADFFTGLLTGENSDMNVNPREPNPPAFPRAGNRDAPYDVPEAKLRGAIYIPEDFQYGAEGAPQPVILVPGTGNTGFITFSGNYIPLLQNSTKADPVWLNIPGYQLNDAQTNSEYVAYAINYIYGISNQRNVAVIGWSQGNINTQWAFKYWPSTRNRVTDHIALSADYHGTLFADALAAPGEPLPPSVLQQEFNSKFITTLRNQGGDSSYVPTTSVYSGFFDEIVFPQQGFLASAFIKNLRGAGASNSQVQLVCPPGSASGTFYTHEGMLYNPLGYALAIDALSNDGPGQTSRLDLGKVCQPYLTPGLGVDDFLLTENAILVAAAAIVAYPPKVFEEPPIKAYAR